MTFSITSGGAEKKSRNINIRAVIALCLAVVCVSAVVLGLVFVVRSNKEHAAERAELLADFEGQKIAGIAAKTARMEKVAYHIAADRVENDIIPVSTPENATEEEIKILSGYTNLGICQTDSGNLNIRKAPSQEGNLCGKLPNNAGCEIMGEIFGDDMNWYHIKSGKIEGYVSADYIVVGDEAVALAYEIMEKVAKVTADSLRVRSEMNTDSEILTSIPNGEEIIVSNEYDDWIELEIDDEVGYCSKEFVEVSTRLRDAMTLTEARFGEGVSDGRAALVTYALQYVGNRYVWGGTSLSKGVDCSGFTMQVYRQFGYSLPHYSGSQAQMGKSIKLADAKPGDLVFYGKGKRINHVAIYMGNGQIVHASNRRDGIKVSSVYYRSILKVVRIINDF